MDSAPRDGAVLNVLVSNLVTPFNPLWAVPVRDG
jgi:hypothetical protein